MMAEEVDIVIEGVPAHFGPDNQWHCDNPEWREILELYTDTTPVHCKIPGPVGWCRAEWIVKDMQHYGWDAQLLTPRPEPPPDDPAEDGVVILY